MNVRDKKGSITVFILVGLIFMSSFLLISYAYIGNNSKISKEQYNIMQDTYSNHDSDADAYNKVYEDLRSKNKKELRVEIENNNSIRIGNAFDEKVINYQIHASQYELGEKVNSSEGKYRIKIDIEEYIDIEGSVGVTSNEQYIYMQSLLYDGEYVDYKTQSIRYSNGTVKEYVNVPTIYTKEEYTRIFIYAGNIPAKIVVDYIGYEFNS